jgi:acetyl/propionyl-CoA carboxylase alpha subunit
LLSKLIVWDDDRDRAIARMSRALEEMRIAGVSTTAPFARFAMRNERFRAGDLSTAFIEEEFSPEIKERELACAIEHAEPYFVAVQKKMNDGRARALYLNTSIR